MYFATLGVIASSVENLAIEIRHLQRSEVREVEERLPRAERFQRHAQNAIVLAEM